MKKMTLALFSLASLYAEPSNQEVAMARCTREPSEAPMDDEGSYNNAQDQEDEAPNPEDQQQSFFWPNSRPAAPEAPKVEEKPAPAPRKGAAQKAIEKEQAYSASK